LRRDPELTQKLLVKLAEYPKQPSQVVVFPNIGSTFAVDGYSREQVIYHLEQLRDTGLIDSPGTRTSIGVAFKGLSPRGHEWLERSRVQPPASLNADRSYSRQTTPQDLPQEERMKRDNNLILELLEKIEEGDRVSSRGLTQGLSNDEQGKIVYHLGLLANDKLIGGAKATIQGITIWHDLVLTSAGHDCLERLRTKQIVVGTSAKSIPTSEASRKVFVVHGHDESAKDAVAYFLSSIGLEAIVLHRQPNRGRHLLTKFQEEAEGVTFAVVLFTPDDEGGVVGGLHQKRARQNVVFELGFFIAKLGAPSVAALVKSGVEKPSDYDGICWIDFDDVGKWKIELARELDAAGVNFEHQKLLRT
jgi:predicted nucleotide-binding protein